MDKNYFLSLPLPAKIEYLIAYGEIINELEKDEYYTSLFLLKGLFIEVCLNKQSNNIDSMALINDTGILYEYLHNIHIPLPGNIDLEFTNNSSQ